ncbi:MULTISPECIES: NIPSNAP family protein [Acidiphilium]|uniref:NIPSNAP family protein n=1 Tax=Acidiphilium iwatense TaxID=768198 RepID=A0ABS9DTX4_9PROT|nr:MULTISPECIES: NIPSNAP family protein [Acidiphilium]MCF3946172.1 NIPSNAP family protein [Acidiphilium iwatense]
MRGTPLNISTTIAASAPPLRIISRRSTAEGGRAHDHLFHPLRDCFIRYEIDPFKTDAFERYARVWNEAIPRAGANLIGYFAPHEGSSTIAYGIYDIENLAAYEHYRARLASDPAGRANFDFSRTERFIRREDRIFLRRV